MRGQQAGFQMAGEAGGTTDGGAGGVRARGGRERLLDAVIAHFTTEGLADQSLRHIAEAVGSSHRMLLHHFGSKDGLLLEVVRAVEARTRVRLEALGEGAAGETDQLIRSMWAYLADPALGDFERLFFALYGRALQGDETIRPLLKDDIEHWLDANVTLSVPLGVPDDVARTHARLGLAVIRGLLLDLLATGDRAGVEAALEIFALRYRGRWWEAQDETGTSDRAS
jgi:AcrR family transcriptional regulator